MRTMLLRARCAVNLFRRLLPRKQSRQVIRFKSLSPGAGQYYNVYRSDLNGTAAVAKFIGKVAVECCWFGRNVRRPRQPRSWLGHWVPGSVKHDGIRSAVSVQQAETRS
jgi:hypothetical protein